MALHSPLLLASFVLASWSSCPSCPELFRLQQTDAVQPLKATSEVETPAISGGSAEAYERAASLHSRFKGWLKRDDGQPYWTEDDLVWASIRRTREGDPAPNREVVYVDLRLGENAERRTLTNTRELAAAIGHPKTNVRVGRLRRSSEQGSFDLLLNGGFGAWRFDPSRNSVEAMELEDMTDWHLPPRRLGGSSKRWPVTSGIFFVNRLAVPVELFWVDYERKPQEQGKLEPGEQLWIESAESHVFRVRRRDRSLVANYVCEARPGIAWIDGSKPTRVAQSNESESLEERIEAGNSTSKNGYRALLRNGQLWLRSGVDGAEQLVSDKGTDASPFEGPLQWSPDGRFLLARTVDQGLRRRIHLIESAPKESLVPELHDMRYAKPGDPIDHPHLKLFALDEAGALQPVPLDESLFQTPLRLLHLEWEADSSRFTFLYEERGHRALRWLAVDAASGAVEVLIEETSPTFIDTTQKMLFERLPERGELLWASERSGWNHLELRDATTGDLIRPLTSGTYVFRSLETVDTLNGSVRVRVRAYHPNQDPYHDHYLRIRLDDGEITPLTFDDGTHDLTFSPDGKHYVDRFSRVDQGPVRQVRRTSDGSLLATLWAFDDAPLRAEGWRPPQRFVAKGRDGTTDIWGNVYRPTHFDPEASYPVIESIYAGPHDAHVTKRFYVQTKQAQLAELGFVVVQIDGMGTNWRSKAFHDVAWQNLHDAGFPDRIAWMRALAATDPALDIGRVGIFGGSAGGQNAMRALIDHHDFYSAAAADCGCHDNRVDKRWWNEAWMGWPLGPHYEQASNAAQAHRMEGDLFLSVGLMDRNVDPSSTLQVVEALIAADKDFELLVIPSGGHGSGDSAYGTRRRRDFFVRSLLGVEPRFTPGAR